MLKALPNIATCGNLISGFLALLMVTQANYEQAVLLVALAAGFDMLDGAIARRCSTAGDFGCNLDSLADLVSFGVVPAFALYMSQLYTLDGLGIAVCLIFLVAGAIRLARFPLVRAPDHFLGLPIPPAGLAMAGLAVLAPPVGLSLFSALALAALMVSRRPFPKLSAPAGQSNRLRRALHKLSARKNEPAEQHNR
ncbi:CDP-diacylglycerol--serine O-phosphatidyltransferase [Rubrobacter aplysinae]|uniref:CDP-diacylglycerol--serine O-phosphatidyltransferase n=1 Tax=Rubrobacter aplysinae TaxID=909625 RepID=UPI00069F11FB|nr:CDP-diacylglycerol--serine O-phosphatidyltransferase [Rubrobacter aplysinae]